VEGYRPFVDSRLQWIGVALAACVALYAALLLVLIASGRRRSVLEVAAFVPDCAVLFSRLLRDQRVPRRHKLLLAALVGYLALPFDLVPDMIPVAGQLDDAIVVALVLRRIVRADRELLAEHWPGSPAGLRLLQRLGGGA
jgi:uncharacterized membrane protein YkvA (DUF1232 family)